MVFGHGQRLVEEVFVMTPRAQTGIRPKAILFAIACGVLIVTSFTSLNLQFSPFFNADTSHKMWLFITELAQPNWTKALWLKLLPAALETLAMSALGTLIAEIGRAHV